MSDKLNCSVFQSVLLRDVEHGRANNLDFCRFVFSSAVIFSHCFVILNRFEDEPMHKFLHFGNLGALSVWSFFFISGFLIYKSSLNSTPERFLVARALRIFPALLLVTIVLVLVVGPMLTQISVHSYFGSSQTYRYLNRSLLGSPPDALPGVFVSGNFVHTVNQPLWTLGAEWTLYSAFFVGCCARNLRLGWRPTILSVAMIAAVILLAFNIYPLPWRNAAGWFGFAAIGAFSYHYRRFIVLSIPLAVCAALLTILLFSLRPIFGEIFLPIALGYNILVVGFHPKLHLKWFHHLGDCSYGLYIYAWPIQQIFVASVSTPVGLFFASYPIAFAAAFISWRIIERPALRLKSIVA